MARCTVARLMAVMGLAGVLRGKKVRTTISRKAVAAGDRVNRQFVAERPDQLWVADFTYVSTWRGFVYVAFIIDVFAGYIVGWRVSSSMETTFVLDALEQALWAVDRPARSITVIKVLSMYRWPTHSGLRKPDYWHQQEVQATRMTTRWRRASMVFTKRR
ncbi:putative transposase [Shigella flexneri K-218]|nr:putative transposase [Shigella flexneri K-218]